MRAIMLDTGAGLLFLAVLLATDDIYIATGVGIAAAIATLGWTWIRHRRVEVMQAMGLAIVLVMGGATILLHDPRFVMFKPTLLEAAMGSTMLKPGWLFRYLPARAAEAPRPLIVTIGYVYAASMFVLAAANVAVATLASQKTWAIFTAFAPWVVFTPLGLTMWWLVRSAVIAARRSRAAVA